MAEVGARDRLVMAGLVILGLLTVIAGVLSGRSTINYVLSRDAREAALSMSAEIEKGLAKEQPASRVLGKDVEVIDADSLHQSFAGGEGSKAPLPASRSLKDEGFGLIEWFDDLTMGWALGRS